MESRLTTTAKGLLAGLVIVSTWLWMTALESEEELTTPEYQVPERFLKAEVQGPSVAEDDIDTTKILEPEPQHGWIVPPEPVRKAAGRVKKKIKRTVKK